MRCGGWQKNYHLFLKTVRVSGWEAASPTWWQGRPIKMYWQHIAFISPEWIMRAPAYFIRLFSSPVIIKYFVWGEGTGQGRLIERVGVWYRHRLSIPVIGGNWWDQVARSNPETSNQKDLIAKTQMDFLLDIFSAFVLCWMWVWRVTSSGRGRVSMTNVVSNERSFGRQWPDYNSLFHFTSSTINIKYIKQKSCCFPQPQGLVFVCMSLKF